MMGRNKKFKPPVVMGDESIMSQKKHGTTETPVQEELLYGVDRKVADRICSFNRHYAEHSGYFMKTPWVSEVKDKGPVEYYDSVSGKLLFTAPKGRSFDEFLKESRAHGWPSFRDDEVNWEYVRVLSDGETVSVDGTHLGHNLPDRSGNRYCINEDGYLSTESLEGSTVNRVEQDSPMEDIERWTDFSR